MIFSLRRTKTLFVMIYRDCIETISKKVYNLKPDFILVNHTIKKPKKRKSSERFLFPSLTGFLVTKPKKTWLRNETTRLAFSGKGKRSARKLRKIRFLSFSHDLQAANVDRS